MIEYNFQIILFYFKILFYGCQKITEVLSSKLNNPQLVGAKKGVCPDKKLANTVT